MHPIESWHPLAEGDLPERWERTEEGCVRMPFMHGPERTEYLAARHAVRHGEPGAERRLLNAKVVLIGKFVPADWTTAQRVAGMRRDCRRWSVPVSAIALAYKATSEEFDAAFGDPIVMPAPPSQAEMLRALPYDAYLRTAHWRTVRAAALRWAENRCQVCNSGRELEVHHRTYVRLGEERAADLTVLCATCHSHHHGTERESRVAA